MDYKLPERLSELRKEKNLTQQDVANVIGKTLKTYQRYERGETDPNFITAIDLADYYDVTLDYLSGHSDERHPS